MQTPTPPISGHDKIAYVSDDDKHLYNNTVLDVGMILSDQNFASIIKFVNKKKFVNIFFNHLAKKIVYVFLSKMHNVLNRFF